MFVIVQFYFLEDYRIRVINEIYKLYVVITVIRIIINLTDGSRYLNVKISIYFAFVFKVLNKVLKVWVIISHNSVIFVSFIG